MSLRWMGGAKLLRTEWARLGMITMSHLRVACAIEHPLPSQHPALLAHYPCIGMFYDDKSRKRTWHSSRTQA